jgi:hypothetical protein
VLQLDATLWMQVFDLINLSKSDILAQSLIVLWEKNHTTMDMMKVIIGNALL